MAGDWTTIAKNHWLLCISPRQPWRWRWRCEWTATEIHDSTNVLNEWLLGQTEWLQLKIIIFVISLLIAKRCCMNLSQQTVQNAWVWCDWSFPAYFFCLWHRNYFNNCPMLVWLFSTFLENWAKILCHFRWVNLIGEFANCVQKQNNSQNSHIALPFVLCFLLLLVC